VIYVDNLLYSPTVVGVE